MAKQSAKDWIIDWFKKPLTVVAKVKLPGGVVGRVSMVLITLVIGSTGMAWSSRNEFVTAILGLATIGAVVYLSHRLIVFADKHPQAALMEGAEFLAHEHIKHLLGDDRTGLIEPRNEEPKIIQSADRQLPPREDVCA